MTLLICPVRPGDKNEELRFALRSWEANLHLPDLRLVTIGHRPSWLNPDVHMDGNDYESAPLAVFDNILKASEAAWLMGSPEDALYMNDDFFCLDPVGCVLPVKRDVSLATHIAQAGSSSHWWGASLRLTASWLAMAGFPHPDSYEVHRPLLAPPRAMFNTLMLWREQQGGTLTGVPPQWRTLYGTLNGVEAHPVKDAKLSKNQTGVGSPWVSTSDQSWLVYGGSIRKRFQKPSRWER